MTSHTGARPRPIIDTLFVVGLISLGEMGYWTYTKEITKYRVINYDFMWMIPAAYALIGLGLSTIGLLVRWRSGRWPWAWMVAVLAFCGLCGWARLGLKSVHPVASGVLALGLAVQLGRMLPRHGHLWRRIVDPMTPIMFAVIVPLATVAFALPKWKEARALKALSSTTQRGTPNGVRTEYNAIHRCIRKTWNDFYAGAVDVALDTSLAWQHVHGPDAA
jgi:hypothetical protein